jgi:hypothetical protein
VALQSSLLGLSIAKSYRFSLGRLFIMQSAEQHAGAVV